ncbi:thiamine phosphate synthase [Sporosalibacterium faouarense]|uniref:thiamine phosphate synthase n=1 Tax=Sporosalibacterium faouarense TaxID=516123 RepID=UPI00192B7202|nr:thiamine phosphate synthase [Sporosalibacterium faouarense]
MITNRKLVEEENYYKTIEEAIEGGVDIVILREKDLTTKELTPIAIKIKSIIDSYNDKIADSHKRTLLIINSNKEVAEKVSADGYHISFESFEEEGKQYNGLLGVSVHSLEEAIYAEKNGADYVLASHIFPTKCKEGLEPKGVDFIKKIKTHLKIPVIALGGINSENCYLLREAGANGIAVMSYIMSSSKPKEDTKIIKKNLFGEL